MSLAPGDWLVVAAYFLVSGAIGLWFARRGGRSLADYFVSGRSLPWWLAGTSMVATTFAADTPLAVTGMVAEHGVAGNWLWWNMVMSGILTVFFYARLWRRAEVLTDAEFAEIRYAGRPAAFLRAFRGLYLALPVNLIVMGWVNLAMVKILDVTLGMDPWTSLLLLFLVTAAYAALSGLWGVVVTDFVQFGIAMAGSVALAWFAIGAVGGMDGLRAGLAARYGSAEPMLAFFPPADAAWMPAITLVVFLGVQWWAAWYPGAEPGGGGYVAQRIFSARTERDGVLATLWFNVAMYAVRPWPWILVALASLVLYPGLADPSTGYVRAMVDLLPTPLKGLMLASFAAAYMSTISTQLNWGASYLVSDVYLRFVDPGAPERRRVAVSRAATVLLFALSALVTSRLSSIEGAWRILIALGAGTGLVYILRWYWWRINAWTEISAMLASLAASLALQGVFGLDSADPRQFALLMLGTVAITTVVWVAATFLTPPVPEETLVAFYRRVRPGGPGWRRVAAAAGYGPEPIAGGALSWTGWVAGVVAVYATLFGTGRILFGETAQGAGLLLLGAAAFGWIARTLRAAEPPAPTAPHREASTQAIAAR
ncbi:MAG TPA: sodium:solute symporter family protein [Longimicrobiaceae bacterium]|nr:sodium:solute symporter family protein [Longimicrobiaceae bacterium]